MANLIDAEFGEMILSPISRTNKISLKLTPSGKFKITYPKLTPKFIIKAFVVNHRIQIRKVASGSNAKKTYQSGDLIGKNHLVKVTEVAGSKSSFKIRNNYLAVELSSADRLEQSSIQAKIREKVIIILRKQAKDYLPHRLEFMAKSNGFAYQKIRFSHASTRWGSCSSRQTISLNIGLMKLPTDLIDYVIIHELCHTRHMNHSKAFWQEVYQIVPSYKLLEKQLKLYSPGV